MNARLGRINMDGFDCRVEGCFVNLVVLIYFTDVK